MTPPAGSSASDNPFVYGEVVGAGGLCRSRRRARAARPRPGGRAEGVPDLAAPLRQVVAGPAGDGRAGPSEDPHHRGHRCGVELVRRVPRILRPGTRRRRHADVAPDALGLGDAARGQARDCASTPIRSARRGSRSPSPPCGPPAMPHGWPPKCSRCPAASPRHASSGWPSRSTSSRPSPRSMAARVEHALRAAVQDQRQVGYVFAGSEPSLMERMLGPRRPFYKAGPGDAAREDRSGRYSRPSSKRDSTAAASSPKPVSATPSSNSAANVPYDVQRLAHETWDDVKAAARKTAGLDDLHVTLLAAARRATHGLRRIMAAA